MSKFVSAAVLLLCAMTPSGVLSQPASAVDQFSAKLRHAQKATEPLLCNGDHVLKDAVNAFTEIVFSNGCRILFDVPAQSTCCVGILADRWKFPDSPGAKYVIGYAVTRATPGNKGRDGVRGRDFNRGEPGGGASRGGGGTDGDKGEPGNTLQRPQSVVLMIAEGIVNSAGQPLSTEQIAKLSVDLNFSGADGGQGGPGGNGGDGGNGEGGSGGEGRTTGPPPGHCGGPRGNPAARRIANTKPGRTPTAACEGDTGEFRCTRAGTPGGQGGDAGQGGRGGPGGNGSNSSDLELTASRQVLAGITGSGTRAATNWRIILFGGQGGPPGLPGPSGTGGLGGFSGQPCGGGPGGQGGSPRAPSPPNLGPGNAGSYGRLVTHPG